ncbi:hypothetical protein [Nocardioides sp. GY 10127]|uniref:hypothetical protein n=1 Tax=Nocardioides sp. GY 10127 TaxID=2569762 RepID=UPI0010A82E8B|nr:hypothetical protein [Nocardioides sp. GY 10127]TIC84111.1 hypothetical protein E8D37_04700 [Nocardioides sp. GY 10127]
MDLTTDDWAAIHLADDATSEQPSEELYAAVLWFLGRERAVCSTTTRTDGDDGVQWTSWVLTDTRLLRAAMTVVDDFGRDVIGEVSVMAWPLRDVVLTLDAVLNATRRHQEGTTFYFDFTVRAGEHELVLRGRQAGRSAREVRENFARELRDRLHPSLQ